MQAERLRGSERERQELWRDSVQFAKRKGQGSAPAVSTHPRVPGEEARGFAAHIFLRAAWAFFRANRMGKSD